MKNRIVYTFLSIASAIIASIMVSCEDDEKMWCEFKFDAIEMELVGRSDMSFEKVDDSSITYNGYILKYIQSDKEYEEFEILATTENQAKIQGVSIDENENGNWISQGYLNYDYNIVDFRDAGEKIISKWINGTTELREDGQTYIKLVVKRNSKSGRFPKISISFYGDETDGVIRESGICLSCVPIEKYE